MNTAENRMNQQGMEELGKDSLETVSRGNFFTDWWEEKVRDVAEWVLDLRSKGGITHPSSHGKGL